MGRILVIEICSVPLDKVRKFAHTLPWRMLTSPSSWILNRWRCCPLENRDSGRARQCVPRSPTFSVSEVPFGWFPPPLQTEEQVQPDNGDCQESWADCREILDHSPLLRFELSWNADVEVYSRTKRNATRCTREVTSAMRGKTTLL